MNRHLKIPKDCFRRSKDRNILTDVCFYYELKTISDNGFFAKGTLNSLHKELEYSQSNIWKRLARLVKLKLIKQNANGYQVVSYDQLFEVLGYDLTPTETRRGTFKIHRVPLQQCKHIKDLLAFLEIRDNLKSQVYRAFNNLRRTDQYTGQKLYCANNEDRKKYLNEYANKNYVQMIVSNDQNIELCNMLEAFGKGKSTHCNPDVTLSLQGICNLLGLSNTSCAHLIINRLVAQKRLTSTRREAFIETTTLTYTEFKAKYSDQYTMRNGMIFRTLSNQLTCIN